MSTVYIVYESDGEGGEQVAEVFATRQLAAKFLKEERRCYTRIDEFEVIGTVQGSSASSLQ